MRSNPLGIYLTEKKQHCNKHEIVETKRMTTIFYQTNGRKNTCFFLEKSVNKKRFVDKYINRRQK